MVTAGALSGAMMMDINWPALKVAAFEASVHRVEGFEIWQVSKVVAVSLSLMSLKVHDFVAAGATATCTRRFLTPPVVDAGTGV